MLNTRKRPLLAAMIVLDAAMVPLTLWLAHRLAPALGSSPQFDKDVFWKLSGLTVIVLGSILWNRRLYDSMRRRSYYDILLSVVESIGVLLIICSAALFYFSKQKLAGPGANVSGWVMAIFMLLLGLLIVAERFALKYLAGVIRVKSKRNLRRILVVGIGDKADEQQRLIKDNPQWGYWIVGFLRVHGEEKESKVAAADILGSVDEIDRFMDAIVVDDVLFAISVEELPHLAAAIQKCEEVGVTFHLAADFLDTSISRIELVNVEGKPVLSYSSASIDTFRAAVKRTFDIVSSATVMVLFSWLFLLCALAIKLTSRGPVFFRQKRVSLNGREFTLLKFRSMVEGAEKQQKDLADQNEMSGPVFKIKNDPRITWVGKILRKTTLDEMPQLWNVFWGDMSVVGPRPLPTYEVANFERWQRRRLSMKPGLTCIWQIKGRNKVSDFNDWMKLDLEYIDNWTLTRDWKIILITLVVLLFGRGAR